MDDFGFDAPSSKKTDFGSDDPTADFLAREQAALGGDADFLASLASVGSAGLTSTTSTSNNIIGSDFESNFPSFADHEASLTSPPVSGKAPSASTPSVHVAADDDDFGAFHSEYPAIETTDTVPVSQVSAFYLQRGGVMMMIRGIGQTKTGNMHGISNKGMGGRKKKSTLDSHQDPIRDRKQEAGSRKQEAGTKDNCSAL
jgi:hypothetical protein